MVVDLDIKLIKTFLDYNSKTGKLYWKFSKGKAKVGSEAGSLGSRGYIKIQLDGNYFTAHRLAWAIFYNEHPPAVIDHINGVKSDNRIENLRDGSNGLNQGNQRKKHIRNKTSKYLGVSSFNGRWRAKIYSNGKYLFLGYHKTEELARDAYLKAKRELHAGCEV